MKRNLIKGDQSSPYPWGQVLSEGCLGNWRQKDIYSLDNRLLMGGPVTDLLRLAYSFLRCGSIKRQTIYGKKRY